MAVDLNYSSIILNRISESQNPSEQIDLISDDDKRIPIHRVILTAASKYFAVSLGPNWNFLKRDRNEGKELEGANGETLRMIVDYCYSGHIELTEDNVQTLLTIASRYQFDLLEEKCLSFYYEILSVNNSVETLMFAERFSYAGLRREALDLICENFESVPTAEVQKLDHKLFQEILESEEITSSEELFFDRLLKWSEHGERKPYVSNLLKLIRLQHIKLETLKHSLEAFYKRFDCTELILAEYRRRASDDHFDKDFRRRRTIFCLFTEYNEEEEEEEEEEEVYDRVYSVVKVGRFDMKLRNWDEIAEFDLVERQHFALVLNQNKIYALGGLLNDVYCNTVSSFDLNSGQEETLPNMNISRIYCTSILFGGYIYVFGGRNDSGRLSSCERFDIKLKTWTEIKSMSMARSSASAVVMNGCIYIAGGEDDDGDKSTFESYDPVRNVWTELASMNSRRCDFALIQSNGFIYAIGGYIHIMEKYDPSKNQWTEISDLFPITSITSGINVNGEIFVLKSNNELIQIKIDESDNCSWVDSVEHISGTNHILTLN